MGPKWLLISTEEVLKGQQSNYHVVILSPGPQLLLAEGHIVLKWGVWKEEENQLAHFPPSAIPLCEGTLVRLQGTAVPGLWLFEYQDEQKVARYILGDREQWSKKAVPLFGIQLQA